jgi:uncharacterized protein DUF4352
MAETPRLAHLMVLLFFCSALTILGGLATVLFGTILRAKLAARMGGLLAAACACGYGIVLLGTGVFSSNKTLPEGQWKYFCEPDCHVAYSIASVRTAAVVGTETNASQANGEYVLVRLKSWFDENSISKHRGDAPLTPVPRLVWLEDASGRRYLPTQGKASESNEASVPLAQTLRPGESYFTSFVFDVPRAAKDLRLLITDHDPISVVTIDHENSPFHGKIYLQLSPAGARSAATLR